MAMATQVTPNAAAGEHGQRRRAIGVELEGNRQMRGTGIITALVLALLAGVVVGCARPSTTAIAPAGASREARDNAEAYAALNHTGAPAVPAREARDNAEAYAALWTRNRPDCVGREPRDNAEAYASLHHANEARYDGVAPTRGDTGLCRGPGRPYSR
jgi:hypothetical protein